MQSEYSVLIRTEYSLFKKNSPDRRKKLIIAHFLSSIHWKTHIIFDILVKNKQFFAFHRLFKPRDPLKNT